MRTGPGTKALLIAATAILLLFLVGHFFGLKAPAKEPRRYVIELDTAAVVAIRFEDRADPDNDLLLLRGPGGWVRGMDREGGPTPDAQAAELLALFARVPVKRVMGMILLLGERYHLTEDLSCRISFSTAEGTTRTLDLGSSTFAPGEVGAWTYVNVPGEKEVYAVEGLLTASLRKPPGGD